MEYFTNFTFYGLQTPRLDYCRGMENHPDWDGDQIWYSKTKVANVHTNDYKAAFKEDFYKFVQSLLPQAEAYAALCPDQEPNESTLVYFEAHPLSINF